MNDLIPKTGLLQLSTTHNRQHAPYARLIYSIYRTGLPLFLFVVVILNSCGNMPSSGDAKSLRGDCTSVVSSQLASPPFDSLIAIDDIRKWLSQLSGMEKTKLDVIEFVDGSKAVTWSMQLATGQMTLTSLGKKNLTLTWTSERPTLEDVTNCLGVPLLYRVSLLSGPESSASVFEIWYPGRGVVVRSVEPVNPGDNTRVNMMTEMQAMIIANPNTLDRLIPDVYPYISSVSAKRAISDSLRPWSDFKP